MSTVVRVRREMADDVDAIREVHDSAFGTGDGALSWESRLVEDLRCGENWIPQLSMVAEVDGRVVGHALATRGHLTGDPAASVRALGIAPVGVVPGLQACGVGTKLMYSLLGAAQALEYAIVCLLGDPDYYRRFGFVLASTLGVSPPDPAWEAHFQALRLLPGGSPLGAATFRYDVAFDRPA